MNYELWLGGRPGLFLGMEIIELELLIAVRSSIISFFGHEDAGLCWEQGASFRFLFARSGRLHVREGQLIPTSFSFPYQPILLTRLFL
jgi:hypothetical protein